MSLLHLHRFLMLWKNCMFGQESEVLADSAALQVENVSNGGNGDLKQYLQQHYHYPQAIQDLITHAQGPASSSMVRLRHLLFILRKYKECSFIWVRLLTYFLCSYRIHYIQNKLFYYVHKIHPTHLQICLALSQNYMHTFEIMLLFYDLCVCVCEYSYITCLCILVLKHLGFHWFDKSFQESSIKHKINNHTLKDFTKRLTMSVSVFALPKTKNLRQYYSKSSG